MTLEESKIVTQNGLNAIIARFKKVKQVYMMGEKWTVRVQLPSGIAGMSTQPYIELKRYRSSRAKSFIMVSELLERWALIGDVLHYRRLNLITKEMTLVNAEIIL